MIFAIREVLWLCAADGGRQSANETNGADSLIPFHGSFLSLLAYLKNVRRMPSAAPGFPCLPAESTIAASTRNSPWMSWRMFAPLPAPNDPKSNIEVRFTTFHILLESALSGAAVIRP
jgi:hypothetical protein